MQEVLTSRGDIDQKIATADAHHRLHATDVVASRMDLPARQRLDIYAGGYVLRLVECLRAEFPRLYRWCGPSAFEAFAKAFIVTQPPGSYTLYDLGARFPWFLAETRPAGVPAREASLLDFPVDLAFFERAVAEVARARGTEGRPFRGQAGLGRQASLRVAPCLRVLELRFPLDSLVRPDAAPARRPTAIAISRVDYRITTVELEPWQHLFLRSCTEPISPHRVVALVSEQTGQPSGSVLARALLWIPVALEQGLVVELD